MSISYPYSCLFANALQVAIDHNIVGAMNFDFGGNCSVLAPVLPIKCDFKGCLMPMLSLVQLIFYN